MQSPFWLEPFCLHPIDGKSKSFMVAAFSSHIGKSIHGSTRYKKITFPLSGKQLVFSLLLFFRFYDMAKILLAECIL